MSNGGLTCPLWQLILTPRENRDSGETDMNRFVSFYTLVLTLLLILLTAVGCGPEEPELVATAAATSTPTSPPFDTPGATSVPTVTPEAAAVHQAPTPEPTPPQSSDRAALLEEAGRTSGNALAKREWLLAHALYPDEFKAKCSGGEFAALMTYAWGFLGIPENVTFVLEEVRVDGDEGWVEARFEKDGVEIKLGEKSVDDEPSFIWKDGKWVYFVSPEELAKDNPCSLDLGNESAPTATPTVESEPTATPQLQFFRIGDTVRLGDLHVTVNGVKASLGDNFWAPEEGNYFIYVDVTFRNEGNQPEVVSTLLQMEIRDAEGRSYNIDFSAASANDGSLLDGEIAPGGTLRGEVGYQLPTSETELTWRFSGDLLRLGQVIVSLGTVAVPVPPPGFTLEAPLPAGEVLTGSDGTEIRVLGIVEDAWQRIAEENSFNNPPEDGMRFYMVRLEVAYPSGASGSVQVSGSDFRLVGDNRVLYGGLLNIIDCGIIPATLGGEYGLGQEIFAGGRVEGNICFQIPDDEGGLILIHEPGYGTEPRRFLSLTY